MSPSAAPDLVVVGAGALGSWTALRAVRSGRSTVLVDAFGPGDPRATSSDASRIIRSSHGSDDFYARWARAGREAWIELGEEAGTPIFVETGVAWFAHREDGFEAASEATLTRLEIPVERLSPSEATARWPAVSPDDLAFVLHEPEAGVLRARRGVRAAAAAFEAHGGRLRIERVVPGAAAGSRLEAVITSAGERITAETFVFAAGPWLPKLFPDVVGQMISVTKQDVFYFGPEAGDRRFDADRLPAWVDFDGAIYGVPAIDRHGPKVAPDSYGPLFDPDTEDRLVDSDRLATTRQFLSVRMPGLGGRPVVESRVCQYESTADTHFLIDRHPAFDNVWLVGGGSGHGFKHAPEIARHVLGLLDGDRPTPDHRFSIAGPRGPGLGLRSGSDSPRPHPGSATR
jgi:sarcosine oxidase